MGKVHPYDCRTAIPHSGVPLWLDQVGQLHLAQYRENKTSSWTAYLLICMCHGSQKAEPVRINSASFDHLWACHHARYLFVAEKTNCRRRFCVAEETSAWNRCTAGFTLRSPRPLDKCPGSLGQTRNPICSITSKCRAPGQHLLVLPHPFMFILIHGGFFLKKITTWFSKGNCSQGGKNQSMCWNAALWHHSKALCSSLLKGYFWTSTGNPLHPCITEFLLRAYKSER